MHLQLRFSYEPKIIFDIIEFNCKTTVCTFVQWLPKWICKNPVGISIWCWNRSDSVVLKLWNCDWTLLFCSCYNFPRNKTSSDFHFNKTEVPINQAQWAGLCGAECFWGSDEIGRFSHEDINMEITIAKVILTLAKKDISQLISLYCWEHWNGIYWSYKTWNISKYTPFHYILIRTTAHMHE